METVILKLICDYMELSRELFKERFLVQGCSTSTLGQYTQVEPTKFKIVCFADDHQLFKQLAISERLMALGDDIRNCIHAVADWMI